MLPATIRRPVQQQSTATVMPHRPESSCSPSRRSASCVDALTHLAVDLHRHRDLAVPEDLHRHPRMHVERDQQRRARLAGSDAPASPERPPRFARSTNARWKLRGSTAYRSWVVSTNPDSCQAGAATRKRASIAADAPAPAMQMSGNGSGASDAYVLVCRRTRPPSTRCSCQPIHAVASPRDRRPPTRGRAARRAADRGRASARTPRTADHHRPGALQEPARLLSRPGLRPLGPRRLARAPSAATLRVISSSRTAALSALCSTVQA